MILFQKTIEFHFLTSFTNNQSINNKHFFEFHVLIHLRFSFTLFVRFSCSVLVIWMLSVLFVVLAINRLLKASHYIDPDTMLLVSLFGLIINIM